MKLVKYLAIGAGVLVALIVVAIAIVAATFDPNQYKPRVIELVKEKYGRALTIDGTIGLTYFPRLGASVSRVALSEPNSTKGFAKVGQAKVAVALWPLLSKQVVVDRVELAGLEVDLVKRKDGRTNIDDLLGKTDKPPALKPAPKAAAPSTPLAIDVSGIALTDAAIGWHDEAGGTRVRLLGANLTTGRIASNVPGKLSFAGRAQGENPKMNAMIQLNTGYRIDLDRLAVALSGLDLKVDGDVPGQRGLKAALSGDVAWAGDNRIELANVKLDATSKEGLEAKVSAPRLALSPDKSESAPIDAIVKLHTPAQKLDAKIALAAVKATGQRVDFSSLGVQLDLKQGNLGVQGKLATPVSLQLEASQATLPQLGGEFTVSGPNIPNQSMKLAVRGRADVNWAKKSLASDLTAKFDETAAKLKLALADYTRVAPQFDLALDRLNVDRYLPPATKPAAGGAGGGATGGAAPPDKPIDLAALKTLNAVGTVHIGTLVASHVKSENVQATLKAAAGRVEVSPLSANLYQGSLAGSVTVNAHTNQYVIRQQLNNVAVGPLLRDVMQKDVLEGRGTVALDVATAGTTVSGLKRGLGGKANVNLRDGALKGINLADIARRARALRSGNLEGASNVQAEKTDFSELTASFNIRNGVARNEDLAMKSPFVRLGGAGDIDIGAGTLNYLAKASIVQTATGQDGKSLTDVRGVTVPVRLTGPFDNLKYSVDVAALATDTAKEEVKRRLEGEIEKRLDERTKGRIGEALKGILGR
jgi:AsmA protein